MTDTLALSKILRLRETEKKDAQKRYEQSTRTFEEIATELFQLLKKKEKAEDSYDHHIKQSSQIETIREQLSYIDVLNGKIIALQQDVQVAREKMENHQEKLTHAHVEVKKYETIIRRREWAHEKQLARIETNMMDEASTQQYLKNR
ncbi:flagellar export protein FliJ [Lentibacillus saliphilus]|uniref:flagellar export protein FliJ n=1 Tax=Lentibacillus saliphilus TaxID=2737028 RepID=UPI001C30A37F|nr:flagellar export protein FliJ [Lentibacillus saliphilus]